MEGRRDGEGKVEGREKGEKGKGIERELKEGK